MVTVSKHIPTPPEAIDAVLRNGWLYPSWVVGASRMRDVSADWPLPGATLHHSVGSWPLLIDDTTSSLEYSPNRLLRMQVRAWPGGEGQVTVELTPEPGGTLVTMHEEPVKGPARLLPGPVVAATLIPRNKESLERLSFLARGSAGSSG
jgi:uncharacterized protein YndB with AHSA1/START domain